MKNVLLVFAIAGIFTFSACGQKENVPEKVKTNFAQKFVNAKKVKWDKENAKEWEAEFKINGKDYSANYTTDGTWKETEYEISKSEIPDVVKNTLDSEFAGYKIEVAEISETADGKVYEFGLEKGKSDIEAAISSDGKVIKKEERKEDEENGKEEKDNDEDND